MGNRAAASSFNQFIRLVPPVDSGAMSLSSPLPAHVIAQLRETSDNPHTQNCPYMAVHGRRQQAPSDKIPTFTPLGLAVVATLALVVLVVFALLYFIIHHLFPHLR